MDVEEVHGPFTSFDHPVTTCRFVHRNRFVDLLCSRSVNPSSWFYGTIFQKKRQEVFCQKIKIPVFADGEQAVPAFTAIEPFGTLVHNLRTQG